MSIKVQRVVGTIAGGTSSLTVTAPTGFTAVSALSKAFIIPATSLQTCGRGVAGGEGTECEARNYFVTADLTAVGSITFERGGTSSGGCNCACFLVEFTGAAGDQDEFVMRGKTVTTFGVAGLTVDSAAISGIGTLGKVVPFTAIRHSNASSCNIGAVMADVDVLNDGSNNVNRIVRLTSSGEPTAVIYNVEWIHANTVVQKFFIDNLHTNNTDRNTAITAVAATSRAWVYGLLKSQNNPDTVTWYAWLSSTTNLRTRILNAGAVESLRAWVIENPTFTVQHITAVDGVADWADVTDPQAETLVISEVNSTRTLIVGHAGASGTVNTDHPAAVWTFRLLPVGQTLVTSLEARREYSIGTSEYALNVVEFTAAAANTPVITAVSSIIPGLTATITGTDLGASAGTVTIGGVAQTVQNWSATSIDFLAVQGGNPYFLARDLVVTRSTSEVTVPFAVILQVPNNQYARIISDITAPVAWRFVPVPDLVANDQLEIRLSVGAGIAPEGGQLLVFEDATWFSTETTLVSFQCRCWDSTDSTWGTWGVQTVIVLATVVEGTPLPSFSKALFCQSA